jgi:uncharacterized membrane protein
VVRLYLMLPNIESASNVANELRRLGVENDQMHLLSHDAHDAQDAHIPAANVFHVSDAWHMTKQGAIAGIICGFGAILLSTSGMFVGVETYMQGGVAGMVIGASIGAIIGMGRNESNIEEHDMDIVEGRKMLLVDVEKKNQYDVIDNIRSHHGEVKVETSHGSLHF